MNEEFTAKEILPGTFDVHFYRPGSKSDVASVLRESFGGEWVKTGHRSSLRSLRWTRNGGTGRAAVEAIRVKVDLGISLFPDEDPREAAEVFLRVEHQNEQGGHITTLRIFAHELPCAVIEEVTGDGSARDMLDMALMRRRVKSGGVCPHCLKPVDDCDCCDADIDPDMGDQ